ncbi:MAG: hypothetical protein Q7U86_07480, partial [Draconibacterium sp.]|nr:hypothetical protein [Draconibacterium sp.]
MVETSKKPNVPAPASKPNPAIIFYENKYEANLEVEDWMTGNTYFKPIVIHQVEKENALQVEDWMLDESLFTVESETDTQLIVEDWMISDEVWNN